MYIQFIKLVLWNDNESRWFKVSNGVKQGGVLSPVLFCVYIDGLLMSLYRAGLGCHIGHMFVGALAYADDLVLLAPTPHAMICMLQLCAEYAKDYDVLFNADKSKCLICRPSGFGCKSNLSHDVCFYSDTVIENIVSWPHLGHVMVPGSHKLDIMSRRCNFRLLVRPIT